MLCSPTYICLILLGLPSVLGQSSDRDPQSSQRNDQTISLVSSKRSEQASSLARMMEDVSEIKQKLAEISRKERCYKGMPVSTAKYILIEPQVGDSVKRPYQCDTATDGGGWIVIARKKGESFNFNRTWEEYKSGFKDSKNKNMWMGNEQMHAITSRGRYELRIEMKAPGKFPAVVTYSFFMLSSEQKKYRLYLGRFNPHMGRLNSNVSDSMGYHNGMPFSTKDRDNDKWKYPCALKYGGGWWFKACKYACLSCQKTQKWFDFDTDNKPVSYSEMKIRRLPHF